MKKFIFHAPIAAFLALAFVLWRGLYLDPTELPSVLVDKPIPVFAMATVEGDPVGNADLPGRIFLLNVWGSYCLPCLAEHPTLMRLSEEGEFPVVGVNYRDRRPLALDWLDVNGDPFEYSILDEEGRFGIDLGVYGAPETFLVDSEGVIRYRHVGVLEENVWREVFMPAIAELRSAPAPSR